MTRTLAVALFLPLLALHASADPADWLERFRYAPPASHPGGDGAQPGAPLPRFRVTPAAEGLQMVRVSLPFVPGALAADTALTVRAAGTPADAAQAVGLRVLTHHPGNTRWVRRAVVSFPFAFEDMAPQAFIISADPAPAAAKHGNMLRVGDMRLEFNGATVTLHHDDGDAWHAHLVAPAPADAGAPHREVIEHHPHFLWVRWLVPDSAWPRIVEVRADSLGSVIIQAHLQRRVEGNDYAPAFGWQLAAPMPVQAETPHTFENGTPCVVRAGDWAVSFPVAPLTRKGMVTTEGTALTYLRSTGEDRVPMQSHAWRRAAVAIQPPGQAPLTALLEPPHAVQIDDADFDAIYQSGNEIDLSGEPVLAKQRAYHRDAIVASSARGDDHGNVTSYMGGAPAAVFGMNRLNHCPPIFEEYYRSGDARLRATALLWCENAHDLSIWWGDDTYFGGMRYNNAVGRDDGPAAPDPAFMWRSNEGQASFCTKGYDSYFYAYEETGDPRMATALRHQVAYAATLVHANRGEARNVGDVADFVRLYRFTGLPAHREDAFRLWRELREKLGDDGLFSQSGAPIVPDRPFIDDDAFGSLHPFAKPYIIGYALSGCPWLLAYAPDEPRLLEMVAAVGGFLAETVDPAGGWRYPAPESSRLVPGQAMEHASQLARAAAVLDAHDHDIAPMLDAIEIVLQARVNSLARADALLNMVDGWERAAAAPGETVNLHERYDRPGDRDRTRDYTEGAIFAGAAPPDGIVYFTEVLAYYLAHRPAEHLFRTTPELQAILDRLAPAAAE